MSQAGSVWEGGIMVVSGSNPATELLQKSGLYVNNIIVQGTFMLKIGICVS